MSAMTTAIILIVLIGVFLVGLARQKRYPVVGKIAAGLIVSYGVFVAVLIGGELYMRYGYESSRIEFSLYGDMREGNWARNYIQRNSLGYRDEEWTPEELAARQTIFVLGDSFTEGWGIKNPADRYTDVLQTLLGDEYAVVEIAKAGYSTQEHQRDFDAYPYQSPDVVIWQYLLNDIDPIAGELGMREDLVIPYMPPIAAESYLASFIYWRINAQRIAEINDIPIGWEYHYEAYDTPAIWAAHQAEIQHLTETIHATGARIIVVMFPDMSSPLESTPYLQRARAAFEALGVSEFLILDQEAASWDLIERIVSLEDAHAGAAFNRRVGQMLYDQFFAGQ